MLGLGRSEKRGEERKRGECCLGWTRFGGEGFGGEGHGVFHFSSRVFFSKISAALKKKKNYQRPVMAPVSDTGRLILNEIHFLGRN